MLSKSKELSNNKYSDDKRNQKIACFMKIYKKSLV